MEYFLSISEIYIIKHGLNVSGFDMHTPQNCNQMDRALTFFLHLGIWRGKRESTVEVLFF